MTAPIALEIYSVREELKHDFDGVMKKVADMGYVGVETAGFPGTMFPGVTAAQASKLFTELGLEVVSAHAPLPLAEKKNEVLETMEILGCRTLINPSTGQENCTSVDAIERIADRFNEANAICQAHGLKFGFHNHAYEMNLVDGRPAYAILLEHLDPSVLFQIDTYWVQVGGQDAVAVVKETGARAPLLHVKDGPGTPDGDMTALGEGVIDVASIVTAGQPHTEWLIVELDRVATDMLEALAKSYNYMVESGLARGNK